MHLHDTAPSGTIVFHLCLQIWSRRDRQDVDAVADVNDDENAQATFEGSTFEDEQDEMQNPCVATQLSFDFYRQ